MIKILIFALAVLCVQNCTSVNNKVIQVNYLWQARHWQEMTWFNRINTHIGPKFKDELWTTPNLQHVSKLKIIHLLMGCGYGKKLIDFLWISAYAVTECRDLSNSGNDYAPDCWLKLDDGIKRGTFSIFIVLQTYLQINKLDGRLHITNQFYDFLSPIYSFLVQTPSSVRNGLSAEDATLINRCFTDFAKSLGSLWDYTCQPDHSVVSQEDLQNEYENQRRIPVLYDFYVYRMNSSTGYVYNHIFEHGFYITGNGNEIAFAVPTS